MCDLQIMDPLLVRDVWLCVCVHVCVFAKQIFMPFLRGRMLERLERVIRRGAQAAAGAHGKLHSSFRANHRGAGLRPALSHLPRPRRTPIHTQTDTANVT